MNNVVPDPCVEAGSVVGLHDVPAVDVAGPHGAVVGALRTGESILRPAKGVSVLNKWVIKFISNL